MRKFIERKFVVIPDDVIIDRNISLRAIGVFAYLSSFDEGDKLPDLKNLKEEITALENSGYLKIEDNDIYI